MTNVIEPTNIGLSEGAHANLKRLHEDRHFGQMADAYRFAISLALANGTIPGPLPGARSNIFGVATIDPDRELYTAIKLLISVGDVPVYRWAERLADWGIEEMTRRADAGKLDISEILDEIETARTG